MWRAGLPAWVAATLFGALAPALVFAGVEGQFKLLPYIFSFTLVHALLLGVPTALLFRWRNWTSLGATVMAAFLVGALPLAVATFVLDALYAAPFERWLVFLQFTGLMGALGAVGGLAFWLTLRWCDPAEWHSPGRARRIAWLLAVAGILGGAALFVAPAIVR